MHQGLVRPGVQGRALVHHGAHRHLRGRVLHQAVRASAATEHSPREHSARPWTKIARSSLPRDLSDCTAVLASLASSTGLLEQLVGSRGDGKREAVAVPERDCKAHVLLLVLQRELRGVLASSHGRALESDQRGAHRALLEHIHEGLAGQAGGLAEGHALRNRRKLDAHRHVDAELHARAAAHGRAKVVRGLAHRVKVRLGGIEHVLVAGGQEYELAVGSRLLRARHGRLEELGPLGVHLLRHLGHALGSERRAVHDALASGHAREHPGLPLEDRERCLQGAQHAVRPIRGLHHGGRIRGDLGTRVGAGKLLALRLIAVPHDKLAPGLAQVVGHAEAHDAQAHESDALLRHDGDVGL
mmetsp:Transcript_25684/g.86126  ORF Transcript_25684/g.86126 Transcript_25684/m.86126 type:complete len:357 (-) Transcript_25684:39-1109(-)